MELWDAYNKEFKKIANMTLVRGEKIPSGVYPIGSFGVVLSCGVRARKALFYKAFACSCFLSGGVKNRHFERKWCSKWCSKIALGDGKWEK